MLKEKKLKHGCQGCQIQDKECAWVERDCALLRRKQITFCFECEDFPCDNLKKLDERHVHDGGVSLVGNLVRLRKVGAEQWLKEQQDAWSCPECGGALRVMDRECYDCGSEFERDLDGFDHALVEPPKLRSLPGQCWTR